MARLRVLGLVTWFVLAGGVSSADEPGKVTSRSSYLTVTSGSSGFIGMCCLEIDEKPAAAFGLYQAPGGNPEYTYLILFKPDPKAERGSGGDGTSRIDSSGNVSCDLKLNAFIGGRQLDWRLVLERDEKAVTKKVITVGGKEYDKDGPRMFLVDLGQEKSIPIAVKHSPASVPTFADEEAWGKAILAARAELIEKSAEAKKFFGESK